MPITPKEMNEEPVEVQVKYSDIMHVEIPMLLKVGDNDIISIARIDIDIDRLCKWIIDDPYIKEDEASRIYEVCTERMRMFIEKAVCGAVNQLFINLMRGG